MINMIEKMNALINVNEVKLLTLPNLFTIVYTITIVKTTIMSGFNIFAGK